MLYIIYAEDAENSLEKRVKARPAHLARLQTLQEQGRLIIAGPMPAIDAIDPGQAGFSGSAIIAEFPSLDAACDWANADPYKQTGVYSHIQVKPFKRVY